MKIIYFFNKHPVIIIILIFISLLLIIFNHLIFTIYIIDKDLKVLLNIKALFSLINFKLQIYPSKKESKKKKNHFYIIRLLKVEYSSILALAKRLKVMELYSDLEFGNKNFYVTIYVDALVNAIYGNVANIVHSKNLYLNIRPNFLEDKMSGEIRLHIRFNLISIILILPTIIRIIKHILELKEGDRDECNKFDTKHYGDNFGNN